MKSDAEILAFQGAIREGDIATAQAYLNHGGGVDDTSGGYTALYKTIHMRHHDGYLEWMEFLLNAGADPNHPQGELPYSIIAPLFLSVGHNIFGATELLLKRGANPNLFIGGGTCLHISAINPRVDMLQLLLDYGADFSIKDEDGKLPIDFLQESWEYRKQTMPGFTGFENEFQIRQMLSSHPKK